MGLGGLGLLLRPPAMVMTMPILRFPPPHRAKSGDEHASEETRRKRDLFAWAEQVLADLGYMRRLVEATSVKEIRSIKFDENGPDIELAIRDALHPVKGEPQACFTGIRAGGLKKILRNRWEEAKKDAERDLSQRRRSSGSKPDPDAWMDDLLVNTDGEVVPVLANLILILTAHPDWNGVLGYDEFYLRVVVRKTPPWGKVPTDAPWTDHYESQVRVWFQRQGLNAGHGDIGRAVMAAARNNAFHPVREYFDGLKWDGKPRLDDWLITYLHADRTSYMRAVGPRWLISAVARIYEPGCKVDHMLILEGEQGKYKSITLDVLASPWFTDRLSYVSGKDACVEMAGVLLIEVAEMDAVLKPGSSSVKAFLTRRYDRYRPPYGKHLVNQPRQCVFAGSINPVVGGYLKDPTGARRFWPVRCHGLIDRDGIKRDRDQLWAEAVVRYKAGAPWWLETPELEALASAEQAARFVVDAWHDRVAGWIGERKHLTVTISEVIQHALDIPAEAVEQRAMNKVARILTALGFQQVRTRSGARRTYSYRR